jgi:hypothetical protein
MNKTRRPRGVRTAVLLILLLPLLGISLRILSEDKNPRQETPARQIDLTIDVRRLGFDETLAYINQRCGGLTYWEAGSSAHFRVTTLPVAIDRTGKTTLSRRYASGEVVSSSSFLLQNVSILEGETKDAATGTAYISIRFSCPDDCITYATTVRGRADAQDTVKKTSRATLICDHGDQVATAFSHIRGLIAAPGNPPAVAAETIP